MNLNGKKTNEQLISELEELLGQVEQLKESRAELKQAEEALQQMSKVFMDSADPIIIEDLSGNVIDMNIAAEIAYSWKKEELLGKSIKTILPPKHYRQTEELLAQCISGRDVRNIEGLRMRKSGEVYPVLLTLSLLTDKEGKPVAVATIAKDITEHKQAEKALNMVERNFRNFLDESPLGISITNTEGDLLYANRALLEFCGCESIEEMIEMPIERFFTAESLAEQEERVRKRQQGESVPPNYEVSLVCQNGEVRHLAVILKEVVWNGATQFQTIYQDITERRLFEAERERIARLESIGTLAGGIAHDFGNLLTGIMGNISLARRYMEPEGKSFERLEEAEKAAERARELTQQLLTFSMGGYPVKKLSFIAKLLRESVTFALRGSNIRCDFSLPDDLWAAEIDEGQMSQVFDNIVINAIQSMPQGGIINVRARNLDINNNKIMLQPKGNYIEIAIEDHGTGIPQEHIARIFEPYFTTKQKGSGLGLTTVYSIINKHNGHISVESTPTVGTTFSIYLPASTVSMEYIYDKAETEKEGPVKGKGKILVMDDEAVIREMLGHMLPLAGYEVEITNGGTEAIERYSRAIETGQPFDVVIMDLTIPGDMGGKEAIKKVLEMDPQADVIVSSGYANDPVLSHFEEYGFRAVVTKPYNVATLETTLHDILKKKRPVHTGK